MSTQKQQRHPSHRMRRDSSTQRMPSHARSSGRAAPVLPTPPLPSAHNPFDSPRSSAGCEIECLTTEGDSEKDQEDDEDGDNESTRELEILTSQNTDGTGSLHKSWSSHSSQDLSTSSRSVNTVTSSDIGNNNNSINNQPRKPSLRAGNGMSHIRVDLPQSMPVAKLPHSHQSHSQSQSQAKPQPQAQAQQYEQQRVQPRAHAQRSKAVGVSFATAPEEKVQVPFASGLAPRGAASRRSTHRADHESPNRNKGLDQLHLKMEWPTGGWAVPLRILLVHSSQHSQLKSRIHSLSSSLRPAQTSQATTSSTPKPAAVAVGVPKAKTQPPKWAVDRWSIIDNTICPIRPRTRRTRTSASLRKARARAR